MPDYLTQKFEDWHRKQAMVEGGAHDNTCLGPCRSAFRAGIVLAWAQVLQTAADGLASEGHPSQAIRALNQTLDDVKKQYPGRW